MTLPLPASVFVGPTASVRSSRFNFSWRLLRQASTKEAADEATRNANLMAGYVGEKREIERLRNGFRNKRYDDVLASFDSLKYPERLAE